MTLLRGERAPAPRTLIDIFRESVEAYPEQLAVDNGAEMLTYTEFSEAAEDLAAELNALGVGRGDTVGVRVKSGTTDLYVAIMGVLTAGAAYVPVDADDPDERARLVFGEADVASVVGNGLAVASRRSLSDPARVCEPEEPDPSDDAWIILPSGSTGTPRAWRSPIVRPRRSSTPRVGSSSGMRR